MQLTNSTQVVNVSNDKELCGVCGSNLLDVSNFVLKKGGVVQATFSEEWCLCKHCLTPFILHYDIFDEEGHIMPRIFVEDINDEEYNWQDPLDPPQKKLVAEHLEHCPVCLDRLSNEMLSDAWLKSYISILKGKNE